MARFRPICFWLLLIGLAGAVRPTFADDRDNCLFCHQFPGLSRLDVPTGRMRLFYVDPGYTVHGLGPHARLACSDCHSLEQTGVVPHLEVTPVDCARQCHLVRPDALERTFSHANVATMLGQSVHDPELIRKLEFTGGPLLAPGQSICLYCHDEPVFRRDLGQHMLRGADNTARCDVCHTTQIPLDAPYFGQHVLARLSPTRPTLELAQICAVCHSDPKVREGQHDPVASYIRSFHGKAALLGDEATANCLDCHVGPGQNVHLMLAVNDPRSPVSDAHRADGCRTTDCHPGADKSIAATAVHLDLPISTGSIEFVVAALFILLTLVSFGPSALIVLLELAQLVVGRHTHADERMRGLADAVMRHPQGPQRLKRFSPPQRVQHWVLSALFALLVVTGFPMKFAEQAWAETTIRWLGGLGVARTLHHWGGVALMVGFALHLFVVLVGAVRRAWQRDASGKRIGLATCLLRLPLMPTPEDLRRARDLLAYLVGLRSRRPLFGRFTTTEKLEYIGVLWGTTLLGLTGLMLWGEQITSYYLGGRAFNIATIIHTYEAFLAVIHVGILHIYNVVLSPAVFPLSRATLTGDTPAAKLAEENGGYLLEVAEELGIPTAEVRGSLGVHGN